MGQGRKKKIDRPARLVVKIPSSLIDEFQTRLFDPIMNRIPMSARADVIVKLLQDWLRGKDGDKYYRHFETIRLSTTKTQRKKAVKEMQSFHAHVVKRTTELDAPTSTIDLSNLLG